MERNSQVASDATERGSKAEANALNWIAMSAAVFPFLVLVAAVLLLLFGRPVSGLVLAIGPLVVLLAQAVGRTRGDASWKDPSP